MKFNTITLAILWGLGSTFSALGQTDSTRYFRTSTTPKNTPTPAPAVVANTTPVIQQDVPAAKYPRKISVMLNPQHVFYRQARIDIELFSRRERPNAFISEQSLTIAPRFTSTERWGVWGPHDDYAKVRAIGADVYHKLYLGEKMMGDIQDTKFYVAYGAGFNRSTMQHMVDYSSPDFVYNLDDTISKQSVVQYNFFAMAGMQIRAAKHFIFDFYGGLGGKQAVYLSSVPMVSRSDAYRSPNYSGAYALLGLRLGFQTSGRPRKPTI
ncbi:hypothetical protein SAMN05421780_101156 [Flexibacter flexilis DSM 6793]|uniref:Outer membrane protein beta-barrel domain-containing protein n=1 Tax=Flexibacter flexilis DSM 6793 TaxID=927664 RepID=A0A1I1DJE5_9BACT|nr:hypothetical protein [Flexibacter flexilis]SFB73188.1 hypothetical protein SAMN05421780_101156 [Flexibacter flexilis DSM 6793]